MYSPTICAFEVRNAHMGMVHGGRWVARALQAEDVSFVFTLCGGHILPAYERCLDESVGAIDVRHEQTAPHAADGWARVTGSSGVAVLTPGPVLLKVPVDQLFAGYDESEVKFPVGYRTGAVFAGAPAFVDRACATGRPAVVNVKRVQSDFRKQSLSI
jgi:hypothetical protein